MTVIDIDKKKQEQSVQELEQRIKEHGLYDAPRDLFPIDALQDGLFKNTIREITYNAQAPLGLVANVALAYGSLAIHHGYDVRVDGEFQGPTSLWCMTLARSGERKSGVGKQLADSFIRFDAEQHREYKAERKKWFAKYKQWEAKGADMSRGSGSKGDRKWAQEDELERHAVDEPEPPKKKQYIYNDVTNEKLMRDLGEHWPSAGLMLDEGGSMLGGYSMGIKSVVATQAKYNSLWSGESVKVGRQTQDDVLVEGGRLVIYLGVQEGVYKSFLKETGNIGDANGFMARFLVCRPPTMIGRREYGNKKEHKWVNIFNSATSALIHLTTTWQEKRALVFSPQALVRVLDFLRKVEAQQRPGQIFENMTAHASKIGEQMARIASVLHVMNDPQSHGLVIQDDTARQAVAIAEYHLHQALDMQNDYAGDVAQGDEIAVLDWLMKEAKKTGGDGVGKTALLNGGPGHLRKAAALDPILWRLVDAGSIALEKKGGRNIITVAQRLVFGVGK